MRAIRCSALLAPMRAHKSLIAAGAQVHRGDLEDLESLRSGAATSDAVIHTAFNHDFSKYEANCEIDGRAIEALGEALAGSDRLLIVTSGTAMANSGPGGLSHGRRSAGQFESGSSCGFGRGGRFGRGSRRPRCHRAASPGP